MARLGIANGAIERITISKDKMFHPANDKVLMEIRASGDGKDSDWVTYDLAGAIPKLDAPVSGIRVVGEFGGITARRRTRRTPMIASMAKTRRK